MLSEIWAEILKRIFNLSSGEILHSERRRESAVNRWIKSSQTFSLRDALRTSHDEDKVSRTLELMNCSSSAAWTSGGCVFVN